MITWLLVFGLWLGIAAYFRLSLPIWSGVLGVLLFFYSFSDLATFTQLLILWGLYLTVVVLLNNGDLRRRYLTTPVFKAMGDAIPAMSATEQEALDAGKVWWEKELFSGKPDFNDIRDLPAPHLSKEEQAFLDGPVEELCRLINDWQITQQNGDLPEELWAFIKQHRFFSMIIPKHYGGLEFSALAHSESPCPRRSGAIT